MCLTVSLLDPGILFSVLGRLKKVKLYTHPDGTKKGDALVTFSKPEAVPVACAHVTGPSSILRSFHLTPSTTERILEEGVCCL